MKQLFRKKNISQILIEANKAEHGSHQLHKTLTLRDLTAMGIAAIT